ncbi:MULTISPECIES: hypothetical protein [Pseudomonas]|uniref:hypothetical protein n=1 Tax=Pseudomonas TaxID=286 RepID=UPI0015E29999|nr:MULTISPECIES: hypothetical protein [Pseudomonas]
MSMFYPPAPNCMRNEASYNAMPVSQGQWRGAGQPALSGGALPPVRILGEFANNFDYFRTPGSPFVSRDTLEHVAERPMTGDPYHDRMTMLAREISRNPEMADMLDGITNGGQQDGLISPDDVLESMAVYGAPNTSSLMNTDDQLANTVLSSARNASTAFSSAMREVGPAGMPGGMRQQRMNQVFAPWPSSTGDTLGGKASEYDAKPYANDSNEALSNKVLARFSALEDPDAPGFITDKSLSSVAGGFHLDGRPATRDEVDIAREVQNRGDLFKSLDRGQSGSVDGRFSRDDLVYLSDNDKGMSDYDLLKGIKDNFRQYTAGANDRFINVSELEEAAGKRPSTRTFTPEARQLAAELLRRPGLLRETDIGIGDNGPGAEDRRFDMINIDYMMGKRKPDAN